MPHSLAAPIVERPSFSRGPDGRTPYGVASYQKQIEDLKSDTGKNATMAKTATRRIDATKSYMTAAATFGQIATVRQKESEFRVKQEEARQKEETLNLQKSFKIERQRFEAEWQRRAEEVDKQCKEHERVLAEVHQIATVASEKRIAAEQEGMRFKASSDLLSLQDTEKKLSGAHEFKDASEVATRSFKLKAIEEARFDRSKASYATKPREELAARQIAEMRRCVSLIAPDSARRRPTAPEGARRRPKAPDGARWRPMAPDGARWRPMAPDGARWRPMAPDGARWRPMALDMAPPECVRSDWVCVSLSASDRIGFASPSYGT